MKKILLLVFLLLGPIIFYAQNANSTPEIFPEINYPVFEGGELNIVKSFSKKKLNIVVFGGRNGPTLNCLRKLSEEYDKWVDKLNMQVFVVLFVLPYTSNSKEKTTEFIDTLKEKKIIKEDYTVLWDEYNSEDKRYVYSEEVPYLEKTTPLTLLVNNNSEIFHGFMGYIDFEKISNSLYEKKGER